MAWNQPTKYQLVSRLFMLLVVTALSVSTTGVVHAAADQPGDSRQSGCTRQWYDAYAVAADAMDMDVWDLLDALDEGKSIADVAAERSVAIQVVIDALVDIEAGLVRQMERGGCLSAAEAESWIAGLPEKMQAFVEEVEAAGSDNVIYLPILMK